MIIGIPKGSLNNATIRLLEEAGVHLHLPDRKCWFDVSGGQFEAVALRAQEIAPFVAQGRLDVGFTSRDLLTEALLAGDVPPRAIREGTDLRSSRVFMKPARWVLAVPAVTQVKTLAEMRASKRTWSVATEIVSIARAFLSLHGIIHEVEHSWGSTEGKAGRFCDCIVDISHSGESLRANGLVEVAEVFSSTIIMISRYDVGEHTTAQIDELNARLSEVVSRYL